MYKIRLHRFLKAVYPIEYAGDSGGDKNITSSSKNDMERVPNNFNSLNLEKIKRSSYEEGFRKGRDHEHQQISQLVGALKRIVSALEAKKETMVEQIEREITKIVIAVARKIVRKEIDQDPDVVVRVAREALERVMDAQSITVRVNPLDWEKLKEIQPELLSLSSGQSLHIEKDKTIERGGSIVETGNGIIDARIEQQIESLSQALLGEKE